MSRPPFLVALVALGGCSQPSRLALTCQAGDNDTCHQLGDMYAAGTVLRRDLARAAFYYEKVCDAGQADVCNTLGEIYQQGGVPGITDQRIEELFARACDGGSTFGCLNLGLVAASVGEAAQAVTLFERACTGGAAAGCHRLAMALQAGEGTPQNIPRAVTLYDQACEAEFVDSCVTLVTLYTAGGVVQPDLLRAVRYQGKIVEIDNAGCEAGEERDCDARDRARARLMTLQQQTGAMR